MRKVKDRSRQEIQWVTQVGALGYTLLDWSVDIRDGVELTAQYHFDKNPYT